MCTYAYVYVHVYEYVYAYVYVYAHVYLFVFVHVFKNSYAHVDCRCRCVYIHISHIHIDARVYVFICTCICICICVCVCVHVSVYLQMYMCMSIYTPLGMICSLVLAFRRLGEECHSGHCRSSARQRHPSLLLVLAEQCRTSYLLKGCSRGVLVRDARVFKKALQDAGYQVWGQPQWTAAEFPENADQKTGGMNMMQTRNTARGLHGMEMDGWV